jgi:uncharacterized membrane protein YfcA
MPELTPEILLYGSLAAVMVGFAKTGIPGMGILVVPVMALIFDGKSSVGILLPMLIAAEFFAIRFYHQHAEWKMIRGILPWIFLGYIPGGLVLALTDDAIFRPVLGGIVLVLLGLEILRQVLKWEHMPRHPAFRLFTGITTGFSTTVGNAAGPVMTIFLLANDFDKHKFMGSMAWLFLIVNVSKIPVYLLIGYIKDDVSLITWSSLTFNLYMIPAIVVGALAGRKVLHLLPQAVFKWGALVLAGVAAVRLVFG